MKEGFRTNLRQMRTRLSLSQQELADLAGVTRQTISGAETGQYVPSTAIALRLARILGCTVEELFWLEEAAPVVAAIPSSAMQKTLSPTRVRLAQIGGRWIAHPLQGAPAFRTELVPADGVLVPGANGPTPTSAGFAVRLLDEPDHLAQTVLIAGCDPTASLWARAAERWHPGLRIDWLWANSTEALAALQRGEVHAAGTHLFDPATGESNLPFVRRMLPDLPVILVNLGAWSEGLLLAPGNPKGIREIRDLLRPDVQIVNREAGSGARHLLESALHEAIAADPNLQADASGTGAPVYGSDQIRYDHQGVAQAIATGEADAGISNAPVAAAWGLDFLPLQTVRYDLVIPKTYLSERPVQALLATLSNRWVRAQLEALGGFDTRQTGEIIGET